jgi:hypothetical protein
MFTVGIFSTHIPYIAFVVFYAYFFISGVNKTLSGEIQSGENVLETEWYAQENYLDSDAGAYHYNGKISGAFKYDKPEDFPFTRKINYPEYSDTVFRGDFYSFSLFCRPPPVA